MMGDMNSLHRIPLDLCTDKIICTDKILGVCINKSAFTSVGNFFDLAITAITA